MKRKTSYFLAPREVDLREESLPALKPDEVLVETVCSAISAGTEMLLYRGQIPHIKETYDKHSNNLDYPLPYGYSCVGFVKELGNQVDAHWRDKLVFGFQPHTTHFIARTDSLLLAPESVPAEACSFLPNMETAVNLVQDAAPVLGERVLVLGQGVVGLLVASLLREFPLESLVTSDCYMLRRKASLELGADDSFDPVIPGMDIQHTAPIPLFAYAQNKFDLTFELSGSPSALNDAIALTLFSGRVVIGSWYGEKRAEVDLGGAFHRSRIQLTPSQVSTISPALSGRWNKARRFRVAWEALERIQPQKWITHRFSIEEAAQAYELIDKNPQETIQVLFTYS